MTQLARPFHLVYLNQDYNESLHPVRSPRDVALKVAEEMGVGVRPLEGVNETFWARVSDAYENNRWKGASAFLVEGVTGADLTPIENPLVSADELGMAVINAPLNDNPAEPLYVVLMNRDYAESCAVLPDRKAVIAKLFSVMEIDATDIESPEDFGHAVDASYAAGNWKGLLIAEVDPRTLRHTVMGPETLGFEMADLPPPAGPEV